MPKKNLKMGIKCPQCGDEIYSMYTHDFRRCSCGALFVDGGDDYCRMGAEPPVKMGDIKYVYASRREASRKMAELDKKPLPPPPKSYKTDKSKFQFVYNQDWEWSWLLPKFAGPLPRDGQHKGKIYKWRVAFGPWELRRWAD